MWRRPAAGSRSRRARRCSRPGRPRRRCSPCRRSCPPPRPRFRPRPPRPRRASSSLTPGAGSGRLSRTASEMLTTWKGLVRWSATLQDPVGDALRRTSCSPCGGSAPSASKTRMENLGARGHALGAGDQPADDRAVAGEEDAGGSGHGERAVRSMSGLGLIPAVDDGDLGAAPGGHLLRLRRRACARGLRCPWPRCRPVPRYRAWSSRSGASSRGVRREAPGGGTDEGAAPSAANSAGAQRPAVMPHDSAAESSAAGASSGTRRAALTDSSHACPRRTPARCRHQRRR